MPSVPPQTISFSWQGLLIRVHCSPHARASLAQMTMIGHPFKRQYLALMDTSADPNTNSQPPFSQSLIENATLRQTKPADLFVFGRATLGVLPWSGW